MANMTPTEALALQPWDVILHDARLLLVVRARPRPVHGNVMVYGTNGNHNTTISALNSRLVYRPTLDEIGAGNGEAITRLLAIARRLLDAEEAAQQKGNSNDGAQE